MFWTHPRSASEKCRLVWIDGRAMFTMDVSSRIINSIAESKVRAIHGFRAVDDIFMIVCFPFSTRVKSGTVVTRFERFQIDVLSLPSLERIWTARPGPVSVWQLGASSLSSLALDGHEQPSSWPQDDLCFGERKLVANTETWTSPKGEVRKAMAPGHPLRLEALRVEDIRPLPEVRMPVGRRRKHQDIRPFGNGIAANRILGDGRAGKGPCRWIEAHRLLKHHTRQRELWQILHLRSAPVQDLLILLLKPGFDVRVLCQEQESPAERVGRGLMTGYHKGQDLVTHLAHRPAT